MAEYTDQFLHHPNLPGIVHHVRTDDDLKDFTAAGWLTEDPFAKKDAATDAAEDPAALAEGAQPVSIQRVDQELPQDATASGESTD